MEKYILIKPQENCGMCGYIWQTIRAIYHNPNKKYYIDFTNSIYRPTGTSDNVWDYFFQQPHTNIKPSSEQIEKEVGIIFDQHSEFIWRDIKPNTPEEIQRRRNEFATIIASYCILLPELQQKIDTFVKENFEGKKVLGVHFRGTDHPDKKNMDKYMQTVKETLVNYDKIFVCSDEYERLRLAEVAFKDKFICYNSLRSKLNNIPLHSHPNDPRYNRNDTQEYQKKIAEDVILEAFLMSKTDFLMCCPESNVNFLARAINPKLQSISL
jgi:hypothetical protein